MRAMARAAAICAGSAGVGDGGARGSGSTVATNGTADSEAYCRVSAQP